MRNRMEILVNEELLREKLIPCREVCPVLLDIFTWKQEVYPVVLSSLVTIFFGLLWYLDPSVLTAVSTIGLILTAADFFLPILSKSVSNPESWTPEKERKFTVFINRIAYYSVQTWNFHVSLGDWKREKPNMYTSCIIVALLFLAWIGNAVNNLLLAYLVVLFLTLFPGLMHRRILHIYVSKATLTVLQALGIKPKRS